jgi:alkanesulfonate monooxygenase SsuD/methylene tetrahydromethanopterin reductase-like flavin-dependent oxidoreductase (luciferase family)
MAVKAEEMGFDSVWVTDHIILPHEIPDRTDIVYRHDMLEPLSLLHQGPHAQLVGDGLRLVQQGHGFLPVASPVSLEQGVAVVAAGPGQFGSVACFAAEGQGILEVRRSLSSCP